MGKIQKKLKPHLYGKNSEVAETLPKKLIKGIDISEMQSHLKEIINL